MRGLARERQNVIPDLKESKNNKTSVILKPNKKPSYCQVFTCMRSRVHANLVCKVTNDNDDGDNHMHHSVMSTERMGPAKASA